MTVRPSGAHGKDPRFYWLVTLTRRLGRTTVRLVRTPAGPPRGSVVDTAAEADRLVRQGQNVVLLVDPGADQVIRPRRAEGRLALFVGEVGDPAVRAAAAVMAGELFGSS
jgi:hypothetical protein